MAFRITLPQLNLHSATAKFLQKYVQSWTWNTSNPWGCPQEKTCMLYWQQTCKHSRGPGHGLPFGFAGCMLSAFPSPEVKCGIDTRLSLVHVRNLPVECNHGIRAAWPKGLVWLWPGEDCCLHPLAFWILAVTDSQIGQCCWRYHGMTEL